MVCESDTSRYAGCLCACLSTSLHIFAPMVTNSNTLCHRDIHLAMKRYRNRHCSCHPTQAEPSKTYRNARTLYRSDASEKPTTPYLFPSLCFHLSHIPPEKFTSLPHPSPLLLLQGSAFSTQSSHTPSFRDAHLILHVLQPLIHFPHPETTLLHSSSSFLLPLL